MRSITDSLPGYWQDKIIIALSILLAASPWLLGYTDATIAQWNAVMLAVILAAGSLSLTLWEPYWPNFVTAFMAFWLVLSPRILGFSGRLVPTVIAGVIGGIVVVLALWSSIRRSHELLQARRTPGLEPPAQPPSTPTSGSNRKRAA